MHCSLWNNCQTADLIHITLHFILTEQWSLNTLHSFRERDGEGDVRLWGIWHWAFVKEWAGRGLSSALVSLLCITPCLASVTLCCLPANRRARRLEQSAGWDFTEGGSFSMWRYVIVCAERKTSFEAAHITISKVSQYQRRGERKTSMHQSCHYIKIMVTFAFCWCSFTAALSMSLCQNLVYFVLALSIFANKVVFYWSTTN